MPKADNAPEVAPIANCPRRLRRESWTPDRGSQMPNDAKPVDGVREAVEKAADGLAASKLLKTSTFDSYGNYGGYRKPNLKGVIETLTRHLAPAIAALVAEVRLQDAKAVCRRCSKGEELVNRNGHWVHPHTFTGGVIMETYRPCPAGPIHDLLKETEENE